MSDAVMGPMAQRVKTDIRVPKDLSGQVEVICEAIGLPKNAFYALAAGLLATRLSPLLSGMKRKNLLQIIENTIQKAITEARKVA